MRVLGHTAVTLTIGSILYNYTHSFAGLLWFLIGGVFVDLDHYIDYIREHGVSLDLKKVQNIYKYEYMNFKKITLIFHSYELLLLLWLAIFIFNLNIIWTYAAIGLALHLFIDQITNPILPLAYFLWFRILNNFETKKIFIDTEVDYAHWYR